MGFFRKVAGQADVAVVPNQLQNSLPRKLPNQLIFRGKEFVFLVTPLDYRAYQFILAFAHEINENFITHEKYFFQKYTELTENAYKLANGTIKLLCPHHHDVKPHYVCMNYEGEDAAWLISSWYWHRELPKMRIQIDDESALKKDKIDEDNVEDVARRRY